jgi:hypothetical protein
VYPIFLIPQQTCEHLPILIALIQRNWTLMFKIRRAYSPRISSGNHFPSNHRLNLWFFPSIVKFRRIHSIRKHKFQLFNGSSKHTKIDEKSQTVKKNIPKKLLPVFDEQTIKIISLQQIELSLSHIEFRNSPGIYISIKIICSEPISERVSVYICCLYSYSCRRVLICLLLCTRRTFKYLLLPDKKCVCLYVCTSIYYHIICEKTSSW